MEVTKLAYLAGIIDGEGGVTIAYNAKRNTHRMRFYVVNTNKKLMDWLYENFGGYLYEVKRTSHKNPKWRTKYEWHFFPTQETKSTLTLLIPFLICKKRQVEISLLFMETIGKAKYRLSPEQFNLRESLRQELKKLNKRGTGNND